MVESRGAQNLNLSPGLGAGSGASQRLGLRGSQDTSGIQGICLVVGESINLQYHQLCVARLLNQEVLPLQQRCRLGCRSSYAEGRLVLPKGQGRDPNFWGSLTKSCGSKGTIKGQPNLLKPPDSLESIAWPL